MVGPEAMTAVKVSYPFTLLNSGISTLIGTGSASVLSRAIGKKDRETVDKIMGNLIALVLILPLLFSNSVERVFYAQLITDVIVLVIAVILMAGAFKNISQEERLALA